MTEKVQFTFRRSKPKASTEAIDDKIKIVALDTEDIYV